MEIILIADKNLRYINKRKCSFLKSYCLVLHACAFFRRLRKFSSALTCGEKSDDHVRFADR